MLSKEERQKSNPPIPNTWPLFGGAAVWASLLMEKLNREIDELDKSGIEFVTEEEKEETMKHVEMLNNTITLFIKNNFSRWLAEAIEGKDFEEYKKNCIFVRQTNTHMLKSNFEPAILRLFNVVHFWQKLPTVAHFPSSVVDFVEAEEAELLLAQQTVLLVVRDYNDILLSLPVQFADIFRIHLKHLDVMITKGLKTVKFNAPNVITFCTKARQMCSDVMKLVTDFKETHKKIVETIIMFLTRIPLIFIDPRHCYRLDEFAQTQGLWRSKMKLKMTSMLHELQDLLRNAFTPFKDDTDPTIKVYWDEYLKLIDSMILEALHLSVKRSLTDLMYALVGDKKAELSPL
ncbi:putative Dynein-1-beta heavy chain, flagellar inner arm I1 complex [Blattamonas nauphoetae]|uniref:Dynein-1-beta heavy chain, flagellar inner arm I1 complex n=1 Tax=Blattamonas nauphoetae TaxID=2049346 RepID=A0ABQ9WZD9_9EUKA|nr:putative Dynein-1-beta heavy chain, flagellar inner arm I1 complex [Blattamonas nauphoetae]